MENQPSTTDDSKSNFISSSNAKVDDIVSVSEVSNVVRITRNTLQTSSFNHPSGTTSTDQIFIGEPSVRRNKINKQVYLKLHRSSFKTNGNGIEALKEKYEVTPPAIDDEKINNDISLNDNEIGPDKNNKSNLSGSDDKIVQCENEAVELRKKKLTTDGTIANIEELQSRLSSKLDKDVVLNLKSKYSPASFGYPKTNDHLPKENTTPPKLPEKPPVPPRRSSTLSSTARQNNERRNTTVIDNFQLSRRAPSPNIVRPNSTIEPRLQIRYENIEFAEPEQRNIIVRQSSSEDSIEQIESILSDFTMDKKKAKEYKEKKRSSSFRRILSGTFFGKDKKKSGSDKKADLDKKVDDDKVPKKTENVVYSDNFQNEHAFNRNSVQRHTVDYSKAETKHKNNVEVPNKFLDESFLTDEEKRYAEMHMTQFNQIKANFSNPVNYRKSSAEDYTPMQGANEKKSNSLNTANVEKYIDTSSSSNTLDSDNRGTYENALIAEAEMKQLRDLEIRRQNQTKKEINASGAFHRPVKSPERFSETPPRALETYQNLQLVKPKAIIPINSERPLPNPYHNDQEGSRETPQAKTIERNLNIDGKEYPTKSAEYHREFDHKVTPNNKYGITEQKQQIRPADNVFFPNNRGSPNFPPQTSPKSPTLENSKLRLPPNREKVNLQPRIKSPIPQPKVSTDKIIATELLKTKPEIRKTDKRESPSLQRLGVDFDYPENDFSERKQINRENNQTPVRHHSPNVIYVEPVQNVNSSADAFEAARWQQKQRELAKSPLMLSHDSSQVVTDATVHIDSPVVRNSRQYGSLPPTSRSRPVSRDAAPVRQRSITPIRRIPSSASLQVSPQKQEIRQSVELYFFKEMQKLKHKQDQELNFQLQYTPYGYVEDPIIMRRSRSTEPNQQRNTRRSASLPREIAPIPLERNISGRTYHREPIPENRPIIYGEDDIYAQKNPNFMRGSPQRRSVTLQKTSPTYEGYYSNTTTSSRPIINRGSLNPTVSKQMQEQLNKKVSFSSAQNPENLQSWPTRNGYVQRPPQRLLEQSQSVIDDEVFLPAKQNDVKQNPPGYVTQIDGKQSNARPRELYKESLYANRQPLSLPKQNAINEEALYVSKQNLIDAKQKQNIARNAQTQRQNEINQNKQILYDPVYSANLNESPYGTRTLSQLPPNSNQSYGSMRYLPNDGSIKNQQPNSNQSYGSTRNLPNDGSVKNQQPNSNQSYGSTRYLPNDGNVKNQQPNSNQSYGSMRYLPNDGSVENQQQVSTESPYGNRQQVMIESPYGTRQNRNLIESPYGMKVQNRAGYGGSQQVLIDSPYPVRHSTPMVESPYASRVPRQNLNEVRVDQQALYGRRQQLLPNTATKESPYGSRQSVQANANPMYISRENAGKQITVTDKVCDMYGQIHETGNRKAVSPINYGYQTQTGIIYGQLQPGGLVLDKPPQYQSYNQMSGNFPRGTRLTASANDMHRRYQGDPRYRVEEITYRQQNAPFNPDAPLPPIPNDGKRFLMKRANTRTHQTISDTESDTSEVRRIMHKNYIPEEEWNSDGKSGRGIPGSESGSGRGENDIETRGRSRNARRDDPRRHTLAGDQQYGAMDRQGGPLSRTMDLEGQPRGYPPPTNPMLFDDDPGIMSEVETSSTGFRRGGKQRSSLPVVRTPSKTLERPLGLVFLQYRNETKRALLPNEITSIDTVKALFVRSFPKQLTMEYLDSPQVKIYIHDSSKDMFYELEDMRSHLREIRDRSVLRLFESADVSGGLPMAGIGIAGGVGHFEDPSYFSEPEFDSEYQHQHIHKSKGSASKAAPYYMGSTASLPRSGLLRAYSPAVTAIPPERLKPLPSGAPPKPQRAYASGSRSSDGPSRPTDRFAPFQRPANSLFTIPDGYMSSPERGSRYEDPYYSQYTTRSGSITPVIDEEVSDTELLDESYSLYGVKLPAGPRSSGRTGFPPPAAVPYDATRLRVENMERQLANLTGLVQKALTQTPATLQVPGGRREDNYRSGEEFDKNSTSSSASLPDETYLRSDSKTPKLGKAGCHKSVSFEKSVSFSDEPPDMNSPKQHSPQHTADTKPPKPAIKSSTLPRTSSQERDRLKPAPPPKPASLSPGQYDGRHIYRDLQLTPEMYNQLRGLQKKAKDLRAEVRNLRRMSQAQAHSVRETIRDTFIKIRAMLLAGGEQVWQAGMDQERVRLSREEDLYKQEMLRLEKDLTDLESTVEELRGNVINRKTRVNMSDVENMALILSKSSKTVADLKLRFPSLQDSMKAFLSSEMEKVVREEKFLKEEPERLESALRRCKKLTGTLVTLKRLASVQEQRLPCSTAANDGRLSPSITDTPPITPTSAQHSKPTPTPRVGQIIVGGDSANPSDSNQRPENALDALLDELQTFSKPHPSTVCTQMPQVTYPESEPPTLPIKGIPPSHSSHFNHPPSMSDIGRKGSMDSATILPTQNLTVTTATGSLRRLHSYPSGSDTDNSPPIQPLQRVQVDNKLPTFGKPPLPERNTELLQHISGKRIPPPPPPRTSSKSPLASPTSPSLPPRSPATGLQHIQNVQNMSEKPQSQFELATQNLGLSTLRRNVANRSSTKDRAQTLPRNIGSNLQVQTEPENAISASNSSSCESVNSQDGTKKRKEELEQRHQELLKKQKALQEQYARLQQLQRGNNTLAVVPPAPDQLLKKTGSESNLLQKMGLQMSAPQMTGSLTNLPNSGTSNKISSTSSSTNTQSSTGEESTASSTTSSTTTSKVYETDIL